MRSIRFIGLFMYVFVFVNSGVSAQTSIQDFDVCKQNASLVNEGFNRSVRYVRAWMKYADPITGLIPRNLRESNDFWNAWDAAADNYPFMVLTSSILMPSFFQDTALAMLRTEERLTSRIGYLPDTYSFTKKGFKLDQIDSAAMLFGAAEYMKDGLIPLTEWLGESPWSKRMLNILNDLPKISRMAHDIRGDWFGNSATVEVNGDLLQVLSRMYWFTGKKEYLDWAVEIAEHYLKPGNLPTEALDHLRIRDHGCEIISGLCELYIASYYARPDLYAKWKPQIHNMLDRILEVGRNNDGLFYDEVDPRSGNVLISSLADNFGYTLNAYWYIAKIDKEPAYRNAVIKALNALNAHYRNFDWEKGSADGYADAIEGALNLYNRERIASTKEWLDSEIKVLWNFQKSDGMIEGWHGDGNFARTTIMYCLWKTQGITPSAWDEHLQLGAAEIEDGIRIFVQHPDGWNGKLRFDTERSKTKMHFPADYPRINQFQQWFCVDKNAMYKVYDWRRKSAKMVSGMELMNGLLLNVERNQELYLEITITQVHK